MIAVWTLVSTFSLPNSIGIDFCFVQHGKIYISTDVLQIRGPVWRCEFNQRSSWDCAIVAVLVNQSHWDNKETARFHQTWSVIENRFSLLHPHIHVLSLSRSSFSWSGHQLTSDFLLTTDPPKQKHTRVHTHTHTSRSRRARSNSAHLITTIIHLGNGSVSGSQWELRNQVTTIF